MSLPLLLILFRHAFMATLSPVKTVAIFEPGILTSTLDNSNIECIMSSVNLLHKKGGYTAFSTNVVAAVCYRNGCINDLRRSTEFINNIKDELGTGEPKLRVLFIGRVLILHLAGVLYTVP